MGYTSYYYRPAKLNSDKFKTLSEELKTASGMLPSHSNSAGGYYKEKPIVLAGWDGKGKPEFTEEEITFNGTEENDMYHESFYLPRETDKEDRVNEKGLVFSFTKTARKPYDFMVCVSLLRLKHHFPECEISSDGNAEDWKPAKDFYKKVFGEVAPKLNK